MSHSIPFTYLGTKLRLKCYRAYVGSRSTIVSVFTRDQLNCGREKCNLIAKYEGGGMFRKQVNSP